MLKTFILVSCKYRCRNVGVCVQLNKRVHMFLMFGMCPVCHTTLCYWLVFQQQQIWFNFTWFDTVGLSLMLAWHEIQQTQRKAFRIPFVRGSHGWTVDSPHKGVYNADLWCFLGRYSKQAGVQTVCSGWYANALMWYRYNELRETKFLTHRSLFIDTNPP